MTTTRSSTTSRYAQLELNVLKTEQHIPEDPKAIAPLFKRWGFSKQPQECMWIVAYDATMAVRTVVEIARGMHITVDVHIPTMMGAVIAAGCERFMLVHNHPAGFATPSQADYELTSKVMDAANACGLFFEDHYIVTPNHGHFSFVDSKYLVPMKYGKEGRNIAAQPPGR